MTRPDFPKCVEFSLLAGGGRGATADFRALVLRFGLPPRLADEGKSREPEGWGEGLLLPAPLSRGGTGGFQGRWQSRISRSRFPSEETDHPNVSMEAQGRSASAPGVLSRICTILSSRNNCWVRTPANALCSQQLPLSGHPHRREGLALSPFQKMQSYTNPDIGDSADTCQKTSLISALQWYVAGLARTRHFAIEQAARAEFLFASQVTQKANLKTTFKRQDIIYQYKLRCHWIKMDALIHCE